MAINFSFEGFPSEDLELIDLSAKETNSTHETPLDEAGNKIYTKETADTLENLQQSSKLKNRIKDDGNVASRRSPRIAQLKIDRFKELAKCKKQTKSNFLSPRKRRFNEKFVKNPAFLVSRLWSLLSRANQTGANDEAL
jgi:hypothetical protein